MNSCLKCSNKTNNPKFCGRSCAASFNNIKFPKRKLKRFCLICNNLIKSNRKYCINCWKKVNSDRWDNTSLGDLGGNTNHGKSGYVRAKARKAYKEAGFPMKCAVCGYSAHVDIAHIKGIRQHTNDTKIFEINKLTNLVALCKNHHWEFDNGFLDLPS